jgi:hypothetical protein
VGTTTTTITQHTQKESCRVQGVVFLSTAVITIIKDFFTVDNDVVVVSVDRHKHLTVIIVAIHQSLDGQVGVINGPGAFHDFSAAWITVTT